MHSVVQIVESLALTAMFTIFSRGLNDKVKNSNELVV